MSFTDFDYASTDMTAQEFEDYKSKYLDIYFDTRSPSKEKDSILNEIDFELELVRRDDINVDYIVGLLSQYVDAGDGQKQKILKNINDIMSGDEKLRSKRELIEQFINGTLIEISDSESVDDAFQNFWSAEQERALQTLSHEERLDVEQLRKLVDRYAYSGRMPRKDDYAHTRVEVIPIRERSSIIERLEEKFKQFIDIFIDNI